MQKTALVSLLFAGLSGCLGETGPPPPRDWAVPFHLTPVDSTTPGRVAWLAEYESEGKVARFRIELEPEPGGASLPAFVQCGLFRVPGSDASILLRDAARALGGRVPSSGSGVDALDVPAVILGRDLSRGGRGNLVAGEFGTEPRGDWVSTKLFLGDDSSEVFLNLDPIGRYGELSMKDEAYGDGVLRELGRLLQGEVSATAREPERPAPSRTDSIASDVPAPLPNRDAARIAELMEKAGKGVRQPERRKALESLWRMGARARDALPVFLEALQDEDTVIRTEGLLGLPQLRPDPQIGVAAVTPLLSDSYSVNQVLAANALADFGETQTAVTYLTLFLEGEAKTWAASGLKRLGPEARGAVPLLLKMLESREGAQEGYAACMALAAIGRDAASALPALEAASRDPDSSVRDAALYAIREISGR